MHFLCKKCLIRAMHTQIVKKSHFKHTTSHYRHVLILYYFVLLFSIFSTGLKKLVLTLPDVITTWNFMAVSLSPHRRVCVSKPLRVHVRKLLYADVRLPYKVTRFEEVEVKVVIYNYRMLSKKVNQLLLSQILVLHFNLTRL